MFLVKTLSKCFKKKKKRKEKKKERFQSTTTPNNSLTMTFVMLDLIQHRKFNNLMQSKIVLILIACVVVSE